MSIKSRALRVSLLVVLSFHSGAAWADYTSPGVAADDEIEHIQANWAMAPLLSGDRAAIPALSEIMQLPSQKLSIMRIQEEVQKTLENQDVMLSWISKSLAEDYKDLMFAKQIGFLPTGMEDVSKIRLTLKHESLKDKVESALAKTDVESYFWDQLVD